LVEGVSCIIYDLIAFLINKVDPVYIAEVSPAAHRGGLVTWSEIATNVGECVSQQR